MTKSSDTTANPDVSIVEILRSAGKVAIIGASNDPMKPSGRPQAYFHKYGFDGEIFPVNPSRQVVQGVPAVASIEELPPGVDLAIVVVSAENVPEAIESCGKVGIPLAIVFASGFAEVPGGQDRQDSLLELSRRSGVRVLGPNGVGAVAAPHLPASFMSGLDQDRFLLKDDGLVFLSQSGAMGAFILNLAQSEGLGLGLFFSTGNEMDISFTELLAEVVARNDSRVVLGYVEGIRNGEEFESALALASERKLPVCLIKVGTSEKGAIAAATHTGSMAGSDAVYQGVFDRHGVHRAGSVEELLDFGRIFTFAESMAGPRVTIITISGGAGALMTDEADSVGLEIPEWDEAWQRRMSEKLPPFASVRNPIDATGVIALDDEVLTHTITVAQAHPETDAVVVVLGNLDGEEERLSQTLISASANSKKPLVVTWVGGSGIGPKLLNDAGVAAFPDPRRTMRALGVLWRHSQFGSKSREPWTEAEAPGEALPNEWDEESSAAWLRSHGINIVAGDVANSAEEAVAIASSIDGPVVLKVLSSSLMHKSDADGVRLGLKTPEDVAKAARDLRDIAAELALEDARLLVQPHVTGDIEAIVGTSTDPIFGPIIMVGLGGVYAEVLSDAVFRPAPVSESEAMQMIAQLRGVELLRGARGRPAIDEPALARLIARASQVARQHSREIESFEINPIKFTADGVPVGVDALVIPRRTERDS